MKNRIAEYICDNYPNLNLNKSCIEALYENYKDKFIVIENGKIDLAAFYYTLDDKTFQKMRNKIIDIASVRDNLKLFRSKGKNVHFGFCVSNNFRNIRNGIREVIKRENPKTISWFEPDMSILHIFKGDKLCRN